MRLFDKELPTLDLTQPRPLLLGRAHGRSVSSQVQPNPPRRTALHPPPASTNSPQERCAIDHEFAVSQSAVSMQFSLVLSVLCYQPTPTPPPLKDTQQRGRTARTCQWRWSISRLRLAPPLLNTIVTLSPSHLSSPLMFKPPLLLPVRVTRATLPDTPNSTSPSRLPSVAV
jgi:hypothetical protein